MAGIASTGTQLVIWRLLDGKPGHQSQSLGLCRALLDQGAGEVHDIQVPAAWRAWLALLGGRCALGDGLPPPDLLVGAGHGVHPWLLACRRAHGGKAVVLMRPSLPMRLFDVCLVPEHDEVAPSDRVLLTRGVLNAIRPGGDKDPELGLLLIGGPSSHYGWDEKDLLKCVGWLVSDDKRRWIATSSRRTPRETEMRLAAMQGDRLTFVAAKDTPPGWLVEHLARASVVWVSEDSVSMVYESLTAGAACGLLPVPCLKDGRVRRGVQRLLAADMVTSFADWQDGRALRPPAERLDESARCAKWIRDKWFAS